MPYRDAVHMGKILARGPEDGSQGQQNSLRSSNSGCDFSTKAPLLRERRSPWIFAIFTKFPARFQNWWVVSTSLKNIKVSWDLK